MAELQRRHQQEVERLLVERDQPLEEESAATATGEEETLCQTDETQQIKRQNAEFILSSASDRSHQEGSQAAAGEGGGEETAVREHSAGGGLRTAQVLPHPMVSPC